MPVLRRNCNDRSGSKAACLAPSNRPPSMSAPPQQADPPKYSRRGSFVQILLQKSFCTAGQKFFWP
jgi:hypothetical protein